MEKTKYHYEYNNQLGLYIVKCGRSKIIDITDNEVRAAYIVSEHNKQIKEVKK